MPKITEFASLIACNKNFELFITGIILLNSVLIGVETYTDNLTVMMIQQGILYIFTFEILMHFIAAKNIKEFFCDGWNVFDLTLVLIGYIPETLFASTSMMTALRVLRVFRILSVLLDRVAPLSVLSVKLA